MAKENTCSTCEHYIEDELEPGTGTCMLLSDYEPDENAPSGAEGQFWCSPDWGCHSHSALQEGPDLDDAVPEAPEQTSAPRRASDYLA